MGSQQSTSIKSVVDVVNQSMFDVLNESKQSQTQNCETVQNINVSCFGDCGKVDITQTSQLMCEFSGTALTEMQTELSNAIETSIEQMATQGQESEVDFLAISFVDQNQQIDMKTFITNEFNAQIQSLSESDCAQNLKIQQDANILIYGKADGIEVNQYAQGVGIASCLAESVQTTLLKNEALNEAIQDFEQEQKSKQAGLSSLFGIFMIIAVVAVVAILAGGGIYAKQLTDPQKQKQIAIAVIGLVILIVGGMAIWGFVQNSQSNDE